MSPIILGVVGCGYWGPNLVRTLSAQPDCVVKSVCDVDQRRLRHLQELYPRLELTTEYAELVGDPDLSAIVIATPVRWHFPMARAALLAGKHVFIEKPMASSVSECLELNELAERQGLIIMIGHTFLYSSPIRKIKEIVSRGELGDLCYISSRRLNLGLFQKDINVMWDLAPHDLSIILYIMEEHPLSVNCQGNANITIGIEDIINLSLTFPNGRFATIQNSWLDPRKVREITFVGTRRMIVYDDLQPLEKIKIYDARVDRPPHYDTFAEFQYSYHYGDVHVPYLKQEEPLKVQSRHFLDCLRERRQPVSNGKEGLELVAILEAATASLKHNGAAVSYTSPLKGSAGNRLRDAASPDVTARPESSAAARDSVPDEQAQTEIQSAAFSGG